MDSRSTNTTTSASPKTAKAPDKPAEKVFIDRTFSASDVLRFDSEGKFIVFEHEKGKFLKLLDSDVEQLSFLTKGAYRAAQALNERHSPEADELAKHLSIGGSAAQRSSMLSKYQDVALAPGLVHRFSRPDKIAERLENGWRFPKDGEVLKTLARRKEGHYEVQTAGDGSLDQVLLVREQDVHDARMTERSREIRATGERISEGIENQVLATGYKVVKQ
jgi:hypothetical protein